MPTITASAMTFCGNVAYEDGTEGIFSASVDDRGAVSSDRGTAASANSASADANSDGYRDDMYHAYAMVDDAGRLVRLAQLLFGSRADLPFFVSPSPLSRSHKAVKSFSVRVFGTVAYADGSSEGFSMVYGDGGVAILSDGFQRIIDAIIRDSAAGAKFSSLLAAVFGDNFCVLNRDDSDPFTGDNVV